MAAKRQRLKRRIRLLLHRLRILTQDNSGAGSLEDLVQSLSDEATSISKKRLGGSEANGYRYLLYLELLDYARNIAVLLRRGFASNTPVLLLRGMYEGLADLRVLVANESSLQNMKLKYSEERLKILKRAKDGNPFLKVLVDEDLDSKIAEIRSQVDELQKDGTISRTIKQRFEDADLANEYEGEYAFFSEFVHRGLKILENQFLRKTDGGWIFPPVLAKDWPENRVDQLSLTASWILRDARKQLIAAKILMD